MRKFKHKTLERTATTSLSNLKSYRVCDFLNNFISDIPVELIETDSKREELIEKDWTDDIISHMKEDGRHFFGTSSEIGLKEIFKKHTPKTNMFTKAEIDNWCRRAGFYSPKRYLEQFLEEHNLLSTEEQGKSDID